MSSIYLMADAGKLSRSQGTLFFENYKSSETRKIFPHSIDQIIIIGNIDITTPALKVLMKNKIENFLSKFYF